MPGIFVPPVASDLAFGLNVGTVANIQNHWREFYNPLPGLDVQRGKALYDFSRRGLTRRVAKCLPGNGGLFPNVDGVDRAADKPAA